MRAFASGTRPRPGRRNRRFGTGLLLLSATCLAPAQQPPAPAADSSRKGEVTIPIAEYRALLEAADGIGMAPAAQARIEPARFRIAATVEEASFEETFDVRVSGSGWLSLPVLRGPLDHASLSPSERGAFFVSQNVTRLAVLGPGMATATLGTTVRLATDSSGRRSFSLSMPMLAVQQGRIELPGARLDVTVTGGEVLARTDQKGVTQLDVAVRPGAALSVAFREQNLAEKGVSAALKASATLYCRSDIVGPNLVTDVTARVTATAGRIGGVSFEIPRGFKVLFLRGAGLLAAETADGRAKASRVSPSPEPLEAQLRLTRPLEEGAPIELPAPRLVLDGPVETYAELRPPNGVLVEMSAPGSFELVEPERLPPGLRALAAEAEEVLRLPPGVAAPKPAVYKLHRLDAAPVLTAQVRVARGHTIVAPGGHALSRIEYEVVSSAKPFLTVHLTPGSRFWGAEAMGRPILPASPETDSVAIPLRGGRRRLARVAIYVLSTSALPKGKGVLEFQPPGTDIPISTLVWSFSLPAGAEYRVTGSDYREGGLAGGGAFEPQSGAVNQSELGQRAQEALAREMQAAGRAPIVPRMPDLEVAAIARTELPGAQPRPIRLEVRPSPRAEEWQ